MDHASIHGSSPHARGTLLIEFINLFMKRFIPACAGNAIDCIA
ncbi:hypothetical protein HMPREF0551_2427 [Lautropia mirabilis ATCC 51599]|uniref:Uncharacterized protein n=1 Tax=Lautropia mirabilis ATCC 51599 TaxID=887898 RepID=E7S0G3_9BURK|nr:hypothetical protein HMPREF0551_2427 [Lautropia mirabilis ATCC 51599]